MDWERPASAVNQRVPGLLWRLLELILEGASLYLSTAPDPKSAMTRRTHTIGTIAMMEGRREGERGSQFPPSSLLSRTDRIEEQ